MGRTRYLLILFQRLKAAPVRSLDFAPKSKGNDGVLG